VYTDETRPRCSLADCNNVHYAKGLCRVHYAAARLNKPCSVEGCSTIARARGMCSKHRTLDMRYGDPLVVIPSAGCLIDDCDNIMYLHGYCRTHYRKFYRAGQIPSTRTVYAPGQTCSIDGCEELAKKRGWCATHYMRWVRHGDPMTNPRVRRPSGDRTCTGCGAFKSADDFGPDVSRWGRTYRLPRCRDCANKSSTRTSQKLRAACLDHYGRVCACCGEDHLVFLTIDHIDNDGSAHRKEIGGAGALLYRWLIKEGFPSRFQTLCYNCNIAKYRLGECPHLGIAEEMEKTG